MRPVTVVVFFLGIFAGIAAPIFRRYGKAGIVLAGGAATLVIVAVTRFLHRRNGNGGGESLPVSRMLLECEIPVLALALVSLHWQSKLFWAGWAIHAAFTVFVAVIVIWLEFFWHCWHTRRILEVEILPASSVVLGPDDNSVLRCAHRGLVETNRGAG